MVAPNTSMREYSKDFAQEEELGGLNSASMNANPMVSRAPRGSSDVKKRSSLRGLFQLGGSKSSSASAASGAGAVGGLLVGFGVSPVRSPVRRRATSTNHNHNRSDDHS